MVVLICTFEQWQDLYVKTMSSAYNRQGYCPELAKKKACNEFWRTVAEEEGCCCCCGCNYIVAPELRGKLLV